LDAAMSPSRRCPCTDRYGHFDDEPRPRVDFGRAERAAHADAVARFRASNAEQTGHCESAT